MRYFGTMDNSQDKIIIEGEVLGATAATQFFLFSICIFLIVNGALLLNFLNGELSLLYWFIIMVILLPFPLITYLYFNYRNLIFEIEQDDLSVKWFFINFRKQFKITNINNVAIYGHFSSFRHQSTEIEIMYLSKKVSFTAENFTPYSVQQLKSILESRNINVFDYSKYINTP